MRVELRRRDERGAIAILAGLLATALFTCAAFAIDFGMAYNSKRQLQTAADAAALTGASYFVDKAGTCAGMKANANWSTWVSDSKNAADSIGTSNRPRYAQNFSLTNYNVDCNAKGQLTVDLDYQASTNAGLGAVVGFGSLSTHRSAQATLDVSPSGTGLRPYAICSTYVPSSGGIPSAPTKIDFPSTSDTTGTCPHAGGNWFVLDCPHPGNGNNGGLGSVTLNGCPADHDMTVVSPQDTTSPSALYNSLRAGCPASANQMTDYDPDCLTSNPGGDLTNSNVRDAWWTLVASKKTLVFPVFCGLGPCNPAGWVQGTNGNGTMYPIYEFAAARVCGYHFGNNTNNHSNSGVYPTVTGDVCSGVNATTGLNTDNYLWLAFTHLQVSGSLSQSNCALGGACDGGLRRVTLTK